jgi:hypothetical protein
MNEKSLPRWFAKTYSEVCSLYDARGLSLGPAGIQGEPPQHRFQASPRPCPDCGRDIVWKNRWNGIPAKLNAKPTPDDEQTWIETAPGFFEPANHHRCIIPKPDKARPPPRKTTEKRRKARKAPDQGKLL